MACKHPDVPLARAAAHSQTASQGGCLHALMLVAASPPSCMQRWSWVRRPSWRRAAAAACWWSATTRRAWAARCAAPAGAYLLMGHCSMDPPVRGTASLRQQASAPWSRQAPDWQLQALPLHFATEAACHSPGGLLPRSQQQDSQHDSRPSSCSLDRHKMHTEPSHPALCCCPCCRKRARVSGFRARMATPGGRKVLAARRKKVRGCPALHGAKNKS